jgi:iron complex outermembrane receptor protein
MGTWLHSSSYFTTDRNTTLDFQKAYDKFDASLRWSDKNDRTYVEVYGDNLTNEAVLLSGVIGRRQRIQVSYGAPRTYGVRVGTKF